MDISSNIIKTQVAIIGAGPTGLSMAAQLIRYDIDFIIIDKNKETTSLSKALVVHARTLEIFKELHLSEKAISTGQIVKALNLMKEGKLKAHIDIGGLGKGLSEFPFVLSLEQSKTEKLLYDFLLDNKKNVLWESSFSHLEQNDNGVTAYYKNSAGQEHTIETQYLIACDGAGSLVRHQLGLSFEGDTEPKLFYVADVFIESDVINKNEFYFFLTKKGFILFFSMEGEGHYRIVGVLPNAENMDAHVEFKDIQDMIKNDVACSLEFTELKWFSTYKIHSRKANEFAKGRCFICGDAGHIHTPAGGQGMNTGIQDAYNLAWKIAFILNQQTNAEVLNTYSIERTENAAHLLNTTDKLFDIMAGTTVFWNFFRQNIFPFVAKEVSHSAFGKKKVFPLVSQTGIAYPDSYLTVEGTIGHVKSGDRMPYFITADGRSVYDYLINPVFKILHFGDEEMSKDLLSKHTVVYEVHHFKHIPASVFGKEKDFHVLLRPDNHISYIGKDINNCYAFLDKISKS